MKKEHKEYIEKLEHKLDYYQKLDRKNMLTIFKMKRVINNYETNFIEHYKFDELRNNYINALQVIENLKKEV
tara:strand:+ start:224 stop:439 length:216 start_codon:yes stop_codon:yes gene_type:complete